MSGKVHIIGLGVSGLSAAIHLAGKKKIALYDSAKVAGGRCRSFYDQKLDCLIDNGNHLLLSGNRSALAYLDKIGARDELTILNEARFPFMDLKSGARWQVHMNEGRLPLWLFDKERRIPNVPLKDYLKLVKFLFANEKACVSDLSGNKGPFFERFFEPLTWAILNTLPEEASARLLGNVFKETFAFGGKACKPMIAKHGLSETFIDPALEFLKKHAKKPLFNHALKEIEFSKNTVKALHFNDKTVQLENGDNLVLALPRAQIARLLPSLKRPDGDCAIVNAHFKLEEELKNVPPFLGLVNSKTHWIFKRGNIISLTISAADKLNLDRITEEQLLPLLWEEVSLALNLKDKIKPVASRLIRERRATFNATPENNAKRPTTRTAFNNLFLAGDWTRTDLPATIEGSIRSGEKAAKALLS